LKTSMERVLEDNKESPMPIRKENPQVLPKGRKKSPKEDGRGLKKKKIKDLSRRGVTKNRS